MLLTDTHAHLYGHQFDADRSEMLKRATDAGVQRLFLPYIDSETESAFFTLVDQHPDVCFPMIGLHPCSVHPDTIEKELHAIRFWLDNRPFVAIGEIGIDLYWDKTHQALQEEVFAKQIDWALEKKMPIAIHSRNAFEQCYSILQAKHDRTLKGVFHCFGDGLSEAKKVMALGGFFLGIGGVLTYKNSGLDAVLAEVPLEYIVLETDAPYLAPVPHRGKRNESSYIIHIAERLAQIKGVSLEEVARITTENSIRLFGV
jgi:TatD DNase family protein